MKKTFGIIIVVMMCVVLLSGCGGTPALNRPQPAEGAKTFAVEGGCEAVLNGNTLTVSGTTNLMDGTNGVITVLNSNGTRAAQEKFTKQGDSISHDFVVGEEWGDVVYGFIAFDTQNADKQPAEVTDVYGKKFENLTGSEENIIWNTKGIIAIFQSEAVTIRESVSTTEPT